MTNTPKKSDLSVRTASAVVMVAVAGTALWLGGWVWTVFVAAVALGVLWEWWGLVVAITKYAIARVAWLVAGLIYVGVASLVLNQLNGWTPPPRDPVPVTSLLVFALLLCVVATDIGAYFAGRKIGGPKIAPKISPSKTWSGLFGGMLGSASLLAIFSIVSGLWNSGDLGGLFLPILGALVAIVAQAGDFFESWMKRQAGVKDSGKLIPGHGGLFDRLDGMLAVLFACGVWIVDTAGFSQLL